MNFGIRLRWEKKGKKTLFLKRSRVLIVRLHHIIQTENEEERDLSSIGGNVTATEAAAERDFKFLSFLLSQ